MGRGGNISVWHLSLLSQMVAGGSEKKNGKPELILGERSRKHLPWDVFRDSISIEGETKPVADRVPEKPRRVQVLGKPSRASRRGLTGQKELLPLAQSCQ